MREAVGRRAAEGGGAERAWQTFAVLIREPDPHKSIEFSETIFSFLRLRIVDVVGRHSAAANFKLDLDADRSIPTFHTRRQRVYDGLQTTRIIILCKVESLDVQDTADTHHFSICSISIHIQTAASFEEFLSAEVCGYSWSYPWNT